MANEDKPELAEAVFGFGIEGLFKQVVIVGLASRSKTEGNVAAVSLGAGRLPERRLMREVRGEFRIAGGADDENERCTIGGGI
jgi:hypothetical protein